MDKKRHVAVWLRMLAIKEIRMARDAKRFLKSQAAQIAKAYILEGHAGAETIINNTAGDCVKILVANYSVTVRDFAAYMADYLPQTRATFGDLVQGFIARQSVYKAKLLSKTTKEDLTRIISRGSADGLGSEAIANNIRKELGGAIADNRARIIARTETHMAASYAMEAQASTAPISLTKTWVCVEDDRTRQSHLDADGQTVARDQSFSVGDDLLAYPGDPDGSPEEVINCRCTVVYEPVSGANIFNEDNG